MTDYTPTTEMVMTRYAIGHGGLSDDEEDVRAEAFDRWLTEHDRQVAERAWDEAMKRAAHLDNPYRASLALDDFEAALSNGDEQKRVLITHPHDGHGPNDTCHDCLSNGDET